jgi:hypothetical protein
MEFSPSGMKSLQNLIITSIIYLLAEHGAVTQVLVGRTVLTPKAHNLDQWQSRSLNTGRIVYMFHIRSRLF